MGTIDGKIMPKKVGYAVGPRLIEFCIKTQERLRDRGIENVGMHGACEYIKRRVLEGELKYGQSMYTGDGLDSLTNLEEEIADAIYYRIKRLTDAANGDLHKDYDDSDPQYKRCLALAALLQFVMEITEEPHPDVFELLRKPRAEDIINAD